MGGSYKSKKINTMATGFGAAIVIVGAMFKIQHWPGATIMLIGGLSVEAILFIMGAFEEPHMAVDWTILYPELDTWSTPTLDEAEGEGDEESFNLEDSSAMTKIATSASAGVAVAAGGDEVSQKLDRMLEDANIGADLIESLGKGMRNLSDSASNIGDLANIAPATDEFVNSVNHARSSVESLSDNYSKANQALDVLITTSDNVGYAEELSKMSKNLSELNGIYEMQLNSTGENIKLSSEVNENISALMQNLSDSVEDTKRYKEQVAELGNNLEQLNTVYGNMLSAMNFNRS
jgi:gliding motility-associated protein GldL